jgi:CheY-like chemotaxis protein
MNDILRLLYIDDDPDTRLLFRELLSEVQHDGQGIRIDWLDSGGVNEALAQWSGWTLDALLVDNRLAGCEGINHIPELRAVWKCPVWVVTGAPYSRLLDRALRNGAQGLLDKDELLGGSPGLLSALLRIAPRKPACPSNP